MAGSKIVRSLVAPRLRRAGDSKDTSQKICRSIERRDWSKLRKLLSDNVGEEVISSDTTWDNNDASFRNPLHIACQFHPPIDVIMILDETCPKYLAQTDSLGMSPLHVAVKYGAAPNVIKFLVDQMPSIASSQDKYGKIPLHWFCEKYENTYSKKRNGGRSLERSMLEVVNVLCCAAPSCVNLEDVNDMTPVEYAVDFGVDLNVLRCIQSFSERDWKRRTMKGGKKHEEIEKCLRSESRQGILLSAEQ